MLPGNQQSNRKWVKWGVVIGCSLLNLPNGLPWYYGNLTAYVDSYFRWSNNFSEDPIYTEWVIPVFMTTEIFTIILTEMLVKHLGPKLCMFLSFAIFDVCLGLVYFTIPYNIPSYILCLGALPGLGTGLIFAINFKFVNWWFDSNTGLISSITSASFGGGALFYNFIVTAYINPDNLQPDTTIGNLKYFSQAEILNRIASIFPILAAMSVFIHIIGFIFIRKPKNEMKVEILSFDNETMNEETSLLQYKRGSKSNFDSIAKNKKETDFEQKQELEKDDLDVQNNKIVPKDSFSLHPSSFNPEFEFKPPETAEVTSRDDKNLSSENHLNEIENAKSESFLKEDLNPYQVLKTWTFYVLWISQLALTYSYVVQANYYKQFGQLFIHDDEFLAGIGTMSTVVVCLLRIVFGHLTDRIGVKNSIVITLATNTLLFVFWYWTPGLCRWLFFIYTPLMAGVLSASYIIFPMASLKIFGESYYTTNLGLLFTAIVAGNFIFPPFFGLILAQLGWIWLFLLSAIFSIVALVPVVLVLPDI